MLPRLDTPGKQADLAALDIIRDREHGVPRFNEFRRQYGLRQLTGFDDFFPKPLSDQYKQWAGELRQVYGTHVCDASKIITDAQLNDDKSPINDCLGHPNGSVVDNIEDVDTVVGWLSESVRPHGFAISETQFVVFILNASRRLFSDRFFTSSFRPEFYTTLVIDWVKSQRSRPGTDGRGYAEWSQAAGFASEARIAAEHSRTVERTQNRRQCFRSMGESARNVLHARMEAAPRCGIRSGVQKSSGKESTSSSPVKAAYLIETKHRVPLLLVVFARHCLCLLVRKLLDKSCHQFISCCSRDRKCRERTAAPSFITVTLTPDGGRPPWAHAVCESFGGMLRRRCPGYPYLKRIQSRAITGTIRCSRRTSPTGIP